jgi:PhzF family phenazine biosynthesis protein
MQTIAREFNLSETIFIHLPPTSTSDGGSDSEVPEWPVRIFVTNAEIPFAGHPTIGAACYALGTLAKGAKKGRLICKAGPIELEYVDGVAKASIPHNFHQHTQHSLVESLPPHWPPSKGPTVYVKDMDVVSPVKGMNFVCAELADLETLALLEASGPELKLELDKDWDVGLCGAYFYVITDRKGSNFKVRTRMMLGALEDPATGSAACGLSCFLSIKYGLRTATFEITQAVEMGRKSDIGVEVTLKEDLRAVEKVELSGSSVKVMEGSLEY